MAKIFSEFEFYSPMLDAQAVRLSVPDGCGGEYYAIVAKPAAGKSFRELRERALSAIQAAIDSGLDPGEVEVNTDG